MKRIIFFLLAAIVLAIVAINASKHSHPPTIKTSSTEPDTVRGGETVPRIGPRTFSGQPETPDTNVIEAEVFSGGIRKVKVPADEFAKSDREREQNLRETIDKDMAAAINADVRAKQEKLQLAAVGLREGMDVKEVLSVMGEPDRVDTLLREPGMIGTRYATSLDQVATNALACISYWPRVGVPFDGRNGQGYKVLFIQFDAQHRVEKWLWQTPSPTVGGSGWAVQKQLKFWNGQFQNSPKPDEDIGF